jgi:hypothetical protein
VVPVGAVAAIVVSFWPAHEGPKSTRSHDEPAASTAPTYALPPPEIVWVDPRPASSSAPPVASSAPAIASAAPSADAAIATEKIPELQAFFNSPPPDSDEWSPEQKKAYRDRLFANLDARERALERELAFAESRGDSETAALKRATLARLRATRAKLEPDAR